MILMWFDEAGSLWRHKELIFGESIRGLQIHGRRPDCIVVSEDEIKIWGPSGPKAVDRYINAVLAPAVRVGGSVHIIACPH